MTTPVSSLVGDFQKFFTVDIASTAEQLEEVYQVRYRVYCEEFQYEPIENFPQGLETDEFDTNSLHCLITHKSSNAPAGCVRLVKRTGDSLLPMEAFCGKAIEPQAQAFLNSHGEQSCEISRLAVDCRFRRRSGEHLTRFGNTGSLDYSKREKRTFSLIAVAAYLSACAMADLSGRPNIYAMMEPFLPKLMKRSGIPFTRIGEDLDYHGARAPYITHSKDVVSGLLPELRELYDTIHGKFAPEMRASAPRSAPTDVACATVTAWSVLEDRIRQNLAGKRFSRLCSVNALDSWGLGLPHVQYV
jgi:N-acyl amino acid synthase of PEP-CTERM/exosortase system